MIPNDSLLYEQIGALLNCYQRDFIQKLMGADADTHSQTLGRAQGIKKDEKEGL